MADLPEVNDRDAVRLIRDSVRRFCRQAIELHDGESPRGRYDPQERIRWWRAAQERALELINELTNGREGNG